MKLFWRSIVFLAIAGVAPLAFGQSTTSWQTNNGVLTNQSGTFTDASLWTNGVPTSSLIGVITVFNFTFNTNTNSGNNNITITVPQGQAAAALQFSEEFIQTTQGTINLNLDPGATLTLGGSNLSGNQPSLLVQAGVTTTFTGGALNILSGATDVGNPNFFFSNGTDTLNFDQIAVTYGSNNAINVASTGFSGAENGVLNQSNGSSITAGNNFSINIGTTGTLSIFGQSNGTYNLTTSSGISLGSNSAINIGSGTLNQDATSTISLGSGSQINVGLFPGDFAVYNQGGNLTLNNTQVAVGLNGSVGALNQTGGNTTGTAILGVGGTGGTGTYNLSGGTATFSQGVFVGFAGGTGVINQSGSSKLTAGPGQVSTIGVGGSGTYNFSGGSVDFQGGFTLGGGAVLSQSGNTALSSEGPATISSTATYTMSGASATFNNGLTVDGLYSLNSGTTQVAADSTIFNGSGIINLGGGTLKLTNDGAGPTYTYGFTGALTGGTSTIDASVAGLTTFTFANALSGPGGLSLIGDGGTTFNFASFANAANNNTYTGSTSISSGLLNATQNDIAPTSSLTLGVGGTLNLTLNAGGMAYANSISGPGQLALNFNTAGDAFVMPNASNFTGSVVLDANGTTPGTLQIYNGTFSNITDNGTGSGVTIGGSSLVPTGQVPSSGTVTLPGSNTYNGATKIYGGFTVFASQFHGDVLNNGVNGTLNGGTLGTLGTLATPGTMTIGGALVSTGTILVNTNGSVADLYTVNGATPTTLSGVIKVTGAGTKSYVVLTTGPGLLGIGGDGMLNDPNGLNTNPPLTLFSSTLSIDPTDSELIVNTVQKPLIGFATTPAEVAVANSLDPLTQSPPLAFAPLLTVFNGLPASEIGPALEELSPVSLQYSRNIAFENSTFLVQRLNGALANLRSGYAGLDLNGISYTTPGFNSSLGHSLESLLASNAPSFHTTAPNGVNYYPDDGSGQSGPSSDIDSSAPPTRMTPSQAASPTTYNGQVMSDSPIPMRTSAPPTLRTSQFSEFVAGDVVLADINQQANMPSKASYTAGDVMAGISFRMTSNLSVGVLFDYNHTNAKTDGNGSKTTVDSYSPGVFATFYEKNFYVNGLFSFGLNDYSNNRNVSFLNGTANSAPTGQQYVANIDFGYDFHPNKQWVVTPTLGLTYTHLDIDSFSENGVPLANLNVNSQSVDSLRSRLGGHVEYLTRVGNVVLQPNISAMWQHEYLDNGPGITSNFQAYATASPFTIPTAGPNEDSALLGCGLTATLDNSMAFYLNYMADVGDGGYLAQSIVGGVKASF